jgi:hypothetical protein
MHIVRRLTLVLIAGLAASSLGCDSGSSSSDPDSGGGNAMDAASTTDSGPLDSGAIDPGRDSGTMDLDAPGTDAFANDAFGADARYTDDAAVMPVDSGGADAGPATAILTGRVLDVRTQMPVAGANVVVAATTEGTTTGSDGCYTLTIPSDTAP